MSAIAIHTLRTPLAPTRTVPTPAYVPAPQSPPEKAAATPNGLGRRLRRFVEGLPEHYGPVDFDVFKRMPWPV